MAINVTTRRTLWNFIDGCLSDSNIPIRERTAVYLDTADAGETLFLLNRGYKPRNLHVVNRNISEVAWVQRRVTEAGYSCVNTYGSDVFDALDGISTPIHAINLDLCGPVTEKLLDKIAGQSKGRSFYLGQVIAVTVLRGREHGDIAERIRLAKESSNLGAFERYATDISYFGDSGDAYRLGTLLGAVKGIRTTVDGNRRFEVDNIAWGRYKSTAGNQSMLWIAAQIEAMNVKFDERTADYFRGIAKLFKLKFGREPGAGDPLFFDPYSSSSTPQAMTVETFKEIIRRSDLPLAAVKLLDKWIANDCLSTNDRYHLAKITSKI